MSKRSLLLILLLIFLLIPVHACTGREDKQQEPVFKQLPELQMIKPKKQVKIKLKRSAKGEYSWDLSGSDVDKIIKVDKRLREYLEKNNSSADSRR